jgi:hypothetical protein
VVAAGGWLLRVSEVFVCCCKLKQLQPRLPGLPVCAPAVSVACASSLPLPLLWTGRQRVQRQPLVFFLVVLPFVAAAASAMSAACLLRCCAAALLLSLSQRATFGR